MLNAYSLDTLQLCQGLMVQKRLTDKVSFRTQIYSLIYSLSSFQCAGYQDRFYYGGIEPSRPRETNFSYLSLKDI